MLLAGALVCHTFVMKMHKSACIIQVHLDIKESTRLNEPAKCKQSEQKTKRTDSNGNLFLQNLKTKRTKLQISNERKKKGRDKTEIKKRRKTQIHNTTKQNKFYKKKTINWWLVNRTRASTNSKQHAYPAALAFITLCEVWSLCWPIAAIAAIAANRYTVAQHRAPQCAPHHTALILIFGLRVKTACIFLFGARVSVRTLETEREKSHEKIGKSTKKLVTTSSYAWYKSQSRFFVCLFRCVELPANESEPTISRSFAIYAVSGKRPISINCRSPHIFFFHFTKEKIEPTTA